MIDDRNHHMVANFLASQSSRRVVVEGDGFDARCIAQLLNRYRPGSAEAPGMSERANQEARLKSGQLQFLIEPSEGSEPEADEANIAINS